jgi:hypothetical protein
VAVSTADPIDPIGPTVTDSIDPSDVTHRPATGSLATVAPAAGPTLRAAAIDRTSPVEARPTVRTAGATAAATDPRVARPAIARSSLDHDSTHLAPMREGCRSASIHAGSAS